MNKNRIESSREDSKECSNIEASVEFGKQAARQERSQKR